ncbi:MULTISPECIES: hypothetical protein [unclassified Pseudomonas]|jgi:hypothetical protein|uniref:Secreted protein n=1 Tax=Pseudomonas syringae TaxID=317 RepID=A0A3T0JSF9_PSESX|nr:MULTISPECIES: hypothetical protein [unclassified Pseudomonas]AZV26378.1 hypothetical protein CT157_10290 [Pseudomonas syringae]MBX8470733.1 hypothetical protein [Pseudomonas sp. RIT778]UVM29429.1 hypothetical protein LOY31_10295 [Pseudomonas sp. B21-021]
MNRTIAALMLGSLLSATAPLAMAGSSVPPTGIPGVNQGGTESKEDKADKKGEEASGSNSGAETHETEKDAQTSSESKNGMEEKKP